MPVAPLPKTYAVWKTKAFGRRMFVDRRLHSLLLCERTWNCLYNEIGENGTMEDIRSRSEKDWLRVPNMGPKSLSELMQAIRAVAPADTPEAIPEDVETRSAEDYRNATGDFNGYITWPKRPDVRGEMTGIPEDVMAAATRHYRQAIAEPVYDALPAIARAILEERERCAAIAAKATIRSLVPGRNRRPIMGRTIIARAILGEDPA